MDQIVPLSEEQIPLKKASPMEDFLTLFEKIVSSEEKLQACIDFMQEALAQNKTPYFKGFWEVRKLCFPLFKEQLSGQVRAQLWNLYIELTREGRRLKNLLDEESAFAVEQIDLAIAALEKEVAHYHADPQAVLNGLSAAALPEAPQAVEQRYPFYEESQNKLNVMNAYAGRINALRKELIKTEMRIRQKNKFFERLSALGDLVFPVRKELIKEVSCAFVEDVNAFVQTHFSEETFEPDQVRRAVFFFRAEIKALQSLAKVLTLNTHAFTTIREQLSGCWDQLKGMEKELKKQHAQQKLQSSENTEEVLKKIQEISQKHAAAHLTDAEGMHELNEVLKWMRQIELSRHDVQMLKEKIQEARAPMEAKQLAEAEMLRAKEAAEAQAAAEKIEAFKRAVEELAGQVAGGELNALMQRFEQLRQEMLSLPITKMQRPHFERLLKAVRDQLAEKKEAALLMLSEDDRLALDQLQQALEEKQLRRKELKAQIEEYRKILGGSNLDFEKAMKYNELMALEKENLEKCDAGLVEIEKRIQEVKNFSTNYRCI